MSLGDRSGFFSLVKMQWQKGFMHNERPRIFSTFPTPSAPETRHLCLPLLLLLFSWVAQAVDPADLSEREWRRQQAREQFLRAQQTRIPEGRPSRPQVTDAGRLPQDESPCFPIQTIELKGEGSQDFRWALAAANRADDPALGRCLGIQGISQVINRVQNAIIAKGFITSRIFLEPQDLKDGSLALTLVPGRIGDIRFTQDSGLRANEQTAFPGRAGDLLNLRDLEQGLENFKRLPSAEADIQVAPAEGEGAETGESDLLIAWHQGRPVRLSLSLDDAGSKDTGKYQAGATLSIDHLFGLNDLFYISFDHDVDTNPSQHSTRGGSIYYSVPYGYWRLSLNGSLNEYHQKVAGSVQTYDYSGDSQWNEVKLSRMLRRDAVSKTELSLMAWLRESRNYIDDTEIELQHRRMSGYELGLHHNHYFETATLDADLAFRWGTGDFGSLPAPEEELGTGTAYPRLTTLRLDVTQPFALKGQRLSYHVLLRGQWNHTPLVPQDRFAIGGRYTVRGFDGEMQLAGDWGWLIRNELGLAVGNGHQAYLGLDYGQVGGQSSKQLVGTQLAGGVLGLRGAYKTVSYDLFVGAPIHKPTGFTSDSPVAGFTLNWTL